MKQIIKRRSAQHNLTAELPPFLLQLLASRGITEDQHLYQRLADLPDPFLLMGMDKAIVRLANAFRKQQKITIVGDFDADGATSTALLLKALPALGFQHINFFVPDRFEFGYGLSVAAVQALRNQSPDIIITVDNGISSIDGVDFANKLGIDVIITDHHLPGKILPDAIAIINPNQQHCECPAKNLAGVGVAFQLVIALRQALKQMRLVDGTQLPNLAQYLDLVALGTVADVVPLDFYNRILVGQGIKRIRANQMSEGIRQLLLVAKKDYRFLTSSDFGFALGPRLNAAGRLEDMTQGIMLLVTESEVFANELAVDLDALNHARKQIEGSMQQEAEEIIQSLMAKVETIPLGFCLYHEDWHQGIVGLVASRIKEKYHRPVIAFALDKTEDGVTLLKGSGRSIQGVHLRDILDRMATQNPQLISKFGGHAMAAGLSMDHKYLADFSVAFNTVLAAVDKQVFEPTLLTDGEINEKDMHVYTAQQIKDVIPWGQGVPEPLFDGRFQVLSQRVVGGSHLKLVLFVHDASQAIDAIWFNYDIGINMSKGVQVVYKMDVNRYRGQQTLQLMVEQVTALTE